MAVDFNRLRARIGLSRGSLDEPDVLSSEAKWTYTSLVLRKSLVDLMKECPLENEDRVIAVAELGKCNFREDDKAALLAMAAGTRSKEGREQMSQDYGEFITYMPEQLQDQLLDEKAFAK